MIVVILAATLASATAIAVVLGTTAEAHIASSFRASQQAFYAAEGAVEWAIADLSVAGRDWAAILDGTAPAGFADGPASGRRTLLDRSVVDLDALRAANRGWRLYAYGWFEALVPVPVAPRSLRPSPFYVVVFVAPDVAEPDHLNVRAEAFGPRGVHRGVLLNLSQQAAGARLESWVAVR